jgi:serine/threonine protein kinase
MYGWASNLVGQTLDGGWTVVREVQLPDDATGGLNSYGYVVHRPTGEEAFLKAIDFMSAFAMEDPSRELQRITAIYNYERDLCDRCRQRRMDRVVHAIADGKTHADPENPASIVQYLIFELAEGDVRTQLDRRYRFDVPWILRTLHHVATGLRQLHVAGIAHQDLKPSNVLVFPTGSKLADLGRSTGRDRPSPWDDWKVPGDRAYAPPELLYGHLDTDWNRRRLGGDAYLLGSLVVYLFLRVGMTSLTLSHLPPAYHDSEWTGPYADVLDYLRDAFGRAVNEFEAALPACLRPHLVPVVRQLCEPDPSRRGHPLARQGSGSPYSLERYVSLFDLLAVMVSLGRL